jgi:large subunit ribosomal protein L3
MGKRANPRHGSMQFWPRVRSSRSHAFVRTWKDAGQGILGFAGYKVGMTHLMVTDNRATTKTKGLEIACPATIVECPPLKIAGIRFYKNSTYGPQPLTQILSEKLDKELAKTITIPKQHDKKIEDVKEYDDLVLLAYTQPKLTGIGKKAPEIFEVGIGGKKEEKLKYAQEKLGKEIHVDEVFKEGQQLDIHAITKGKGFQGAVRRFGISIRHHKSEKDIRNPGSLGGWSAQGHVMYRVAHAGRMGYAQRTEYNKQVLKIGKDVKDVQPQGGFFHYGTIRNPYLIIRGSLAGAKKRLLKFSHAIRPSAKISKDAPIITYLSKDTKQ